MEKLEKNSFAVITHIQQYALYKTQKNESNKEVLESFCQSSLYLEILMRVETQHK